MIAAVCPAAISFLAMSRQMNPLVVILSVLALVIGVNWPKPRVVRKLFASIRAGGKPQVGAWLFRLLGWDGVLPIVVALIAAGTDLVFPKNRIAIAVVAVYGSLFALYARGVMGLKQVHSNNCDEEVRVFQSMMLIVGMLTLLFVDASIIVSHMDNLEPVFATTADRIMAGTVVVIYLAAMALAMYPGPLRDDIDRDK